MRFKLGLYLLFLIMIPTLQGQDSSSTPPDNPLDIYLDEMDEMGRTLSGWRGENNGEGSWFFGSFAMVLLRNNGKGGNQPYPGLESIVPALWSDFKYLTPRYLVELAGGALSNGNLMAIAKTIDYNKLRAEQKFIIQVAGFAHLRMLQGTIGDSLFSQIVHATLQASPSAASITQNLIETISMNCCPELGKQFELALTSSRWTDVELKSVRLMGDSTKIQIQQNGIWHFPVEVLVISESGDSTFHDYDLSRTSDLVIPEVNVSKVVLDPEHILVEYFRYNNTWPRLKDNLHLQPFAALPDWRGYRITVNPTIWSDWDDEKRYGLKFTSGFGVDLWPAYPSDYKHRITFELNAHAPSDSSYQWGSSFSYGTPVNLDNRLFSQFNLHNYTDWDGISLGFTRYIGKQSYLIQGPRLTYQRVNLTIEHDHYADEQVWVRDQEIKILKGSYTALSITRLGDRLHLVMRTGYGDGPDGSFAVAKSNLDLTGVFWGWLVGGLQFVGGTQSTNTPEPYQFSHNYAWQDGLSAMPNFRGQNKLDHRTNDYLGVGISGGYWMSGIQLKVFTSSMVVDMQSLGWDKVEAHNAAGFGFEHTSFFTAGLYFPLWQSHPLEGEKPWAWRYQWRLTWNL